MLLCIIDRHGEGIGAKGIWCNLQGDVVPLDSLCLLEWASKLSRFWRDRWWERSQSSSKCSQQGHAEQDPTSNDGLPLDPPPNPSGQPVYRRDVSPRNHLEMVLVNLGSLRFFSSCI